MASALTRATFTVDGVSANAGAPISGSINAAGTGATPTATVSGGYNNMVSIDALQEFKISTSSFAPEFGRTPGGQISMVSRGGTNAIRGDVFEYVRNTVLDANDWFLNTTGKPRGIVQQNDFGGVVGGPVIKDKLFFFVSYEGLRLNSPNPSVKVVPTQAARTLAANTTDNGVPGYMAQFLNAYPLPDGNPSAACTSSASCFANFTGSFPGRAVLDATSVRMDYAVNGHMTLFGRYSHSPNNSNVDNSVYARALTGGNDIYTAGLTSVISSSMNNDLRFNFTHTTFVGGYDPLNFQGNLSTIFPGGYAQPPSQYSIALMTLQFGTGIANFDTLIWGPDSSSNGNDQINITETFGWIRGHHELKFGGDWRQLTPSYHQSDFNWNNQFALTIGSSPNYCPGGTVPGYSCGIASLSNIQHNIPQHFRFENYSFFGQDTWKIAPRLTLTYGLRWEINPAVAWTSDNPSFSVNRSTFNLANLTALTLNTLGTPAYPTRWRNVSPRFGIAYQLSTNPKWGRVIRAGYGVFYDTGQQVFALASNPWSARYNNQGPPIVPVQFPISTAGAVYVTPPIIPNPPSFPLYLQTDDLIDPNFRLPYVHEFNFTVEQQLAPARALRPVMSVRWGDA